MSCTPSCKQEQPLPDVRKTATVAHPAALELVGMSGVQVPLKIIDGNGKHIMLPATADFFVSLDVPDAKGIHMSRLYLLATRLLTERVLDTALLRSIITSFVTSQKGLSSKAIVRLSFAFPMEKMALVSGEKGWRQYPLTIIAKGTAEHVAIEQHVQITYSSACPCSAALSRQLIQKHFRRSFEDNDIIPFDDILRFLGTDEAILAIPHSQRNSCQFNSGSTG